MRSKVLQVFLIAIRKKIQNWRLSKSRDFSKFPFLEYSFPFLDGENRKKESGSGGGTRSSKVREKKANALKPLLRFLLLSQHQIVNVIQKKEACPNPVSSGSERIFKASYCGRGRGRGDPE